MQHSRGSVLEVKAKVCCLQLLHQLVFKRQELTISKKKLKLQQEHHSQSFWKQIHLKYHFQRLTYRRPNNYTKHHTVVFPSQKCFRPLAVEEVCHNNRCHTEQKHSSVPLTASSQTRADNPTNIRTRCAIYTSTVQFFNSNERSAIEIHECYRNSRLIYI